MLARKLDEEGNGIFLVEITSFLTPMYLKPTIITFRFAFKHTTGALEFAAVRCATNIDPRLMIIHYH
jgi:hypothetical protein